MSHDPIMYPPRLLQRRELLRQMTLVAASTCISMPASWAGTHKTPALRLVSVGGALTEIIYALGAESLLVGVDSTSLYPGRVAHLPVVGYARTLSSEGILSLQPSHVLATEDAGPPAVLQQLRHAGITLNILAANHRFEGVLDRITRTGMLLQRSPQAARLNAQLQSQWQQMQQTLRKRSTTPPRVLFVLSHSPNQIMVGGRGTSADAMLRYVGALNAVASIDGFKPLAPEAVIAAQPDVVLFTDQGLKAIGGIEGALQIPGIQQTPAGKKQRIVALEAMFLLGFGPRIPSAATALDTTLQKAMQG